MPKLTSGDLKKLISGWTSDPSFRDVLDETYDIHNQLGYGPGDYLFEGVSLPEGTHPDRLLDALFDLWKDGSKWKRMSKARLGASAPDYFIVKHGFRPTFACIDNGDSNEKLVELFCAHPADAAKCWLRMFAAPGPLGENYRIEVVTTPEDSDVVGWTIVSD